MVPVQVIVCQDSDPPPSDLECIESGVSTSIEDYARRVFHFSRGGATFKISGGSYSSTRSVCEDKMHQKCIFRNLWGAYNAAPDP